MGMFGVWKGTPGESNYHESKYKYKYTCTLYINVKLEQIYMNRYISKFHSKPPKLQNKIKQIDGFCNKETR